MFASGIEDRTAVDNAFGSSTRAMYDHALADAGRYMVPLTWVDVGLEQSGVHGDHARWVMEDTGRVQATLDMSRVPASAIGDWTGNGRAFRVVFEQADSEQLVTHVASRADAARIAEACSAVPDGVTPAAHAAMVVGWLTTYTPALTGHLDDSFEEEAELFADVGCFEDLHGVCDPNDYHYYVETDTGVEFDPTDPVGMAVVNAAVATVDEAYPWPAPRYRT